MKVKELIKEDVFRPIETVIKADDREHVFQEVSEYVVTNEVTRKIRDLFSSYIETTGINGVWISGFFGSGKSHLLKILSYVFENREFEGKKLGEIFSEKVESDEFLKADIINATKIPSESILFNIDQQAQITSKEDSDAILGVFYKVLNDHLGYFGRQPHIAEFERWLDKEGKLKEFKKSYKNQGGEDWENARLKYFTPKVKNTAAAVCSQLFGEREEEYENIFDTLKKDAKISVEDFCQKVWDYLQSKGNDFRLNFFVDEVGQYISDNTKLMLNLQTIAETLATQCKGRSWIIVTSQEDIDSIVGDKTKSQSDDFSKIQGRFRIRIPLTSSNVDEVIEKRLLTKDSDNGARRELGSIWQKERANLKTLISFSDIGVQFKSFKGEDDFINKYPFLPYQFDLFQQCIKALSQHNAFQGKHASVGERSVLGTFQEVLKSVADKEHDVLISFDQLFDGHRSTFRSEIQNLIILAENNLSDQMAIRVLKALFLVKYFGNFKATSRNVATLMIDNIHPDLKAHEDKVNESLNLLELQNYIQRSGDQFEFLTDKERDIETEIKNTSTDNTSDFLNSIFFEGVLRDNKITYIETKQSYDFTKKVDGRISGREKELAIDIITPESEHYGNENFYTAQTMGHNTLMMMVIPSDQRFMNDIRMFLRTEKYLKQNSSQTDPNIRRIIYDKSQLNSQRRSAIINRAKQLLGEADVYLNGTKHKVANTADGVNKVVSAFQDLVKLAYSNLKMIGATQYSEETVKSVMRSTQDDLFKNDPNLSESESEIFTYVQRRKQNSERTSLTDIKEFFSKKPYGWYENSIWTITARLYKRGKVEFKQGTDLLEGDNALEALTNNRLHLNVLVLPQIDFDQRLVTRLKQVYKDLFDEPCPANEPKEIATTFQAKARVLKAEVHNLLSSKNSYPFLIKLEQIDEMLGDLIRKDYSVLINSIEKWEDEILDQKENYLDTIRRFWNGDQKKIFDQVNMYIQGDQSNFSYIEGDELKKLNNIYDSLEPYKGNAMKEAKDLMESLQKKVITKIESEKKAALNKIGIISREFHYNADFKKLEETVQNQILSSFNHLENAVKEERYIGNIRSKVSLAEQTKVEQLNKVAKLVFEEDPDKPQVKYVRKEEIKISFSKPELQSKEDVEEYIDSIKEAYLKQIEDNKRISL